MSFLSFPLSISISLIFYCIGAVRVERYYSRESNDTRIKKGLENIKIVVTYSIIKSSY